MASIPLWKRKWCFWARSKQQCKHCKLEFLSSRGAKTTTQSWRVLPKLQSSVSILHCPQRCWERSSHPGMQQAEHLMDQQPIPLHLSLMRDPRFYAKSSGLEDGGGRNDRPCLSQKREKVLPDAYGWLPSLSEPLGKQKPRESSVRAGTNSQFLTLYSAHLQHSKNQETNRKRIPALMSLKLFLGEFNTVEVCCCQKKKTRILFYTQTDLVSTLSSLLAWKDFKVSHRAR